MQIQCFRQQMGTDSEKQNQQRCTSLPNKLLSKEKGQFMTLLSMLNGCFFFGTLTKTIAFITRTIENQRNRTSIISAQRFHFFFTDFVSVLCSYYFVCLCTHYCKRGRFSFQNSNYCDFSYYAHMVLLVCKQQILLLYFYITLVWPLAEHVESATLVGTGPIKNLLYYYFSLII